MTDQPPARATLSAVPTAAVLGGLLLIGLTLLGYQIAQSIVDIKLLERSVEVKGLSEREVTADIAIWPISYNVADNDLGNLYLVLQDKNANVIAFLKANGFEDKEISSSAPAVVDKQAREYNDGSASAYRYTATSTITVYSSKVEAVRDTMTKLADLGKQGIAIAGDAYSTQFMYSKLNDIKPAMIEEATKNAREAATKFAKDSDSSLGKIKRANQGTFSIENRDSSTAHIKKVRVVSTVEYYLSD
ncbi:SIMPL domain-containing protein [Pseudomethylobacillus aquaticus]|uniref:SIMPL domain-containing protein n=1 Tax=Pseudomethylobacillus aquaticus TaxID=2676064 RepID=A0A3N0V6S3_9PROT|nr:SIMPL domain-containing protein [Pseudomethylobacillus aquaticus]ROH88304.1 SIMPL domain-containing protein [Pseudomethylobacillus aquaticus]